MSDSSKSGGMKSAYEIALERMAQQGVEPPSRDSLSDDIRRQMEAARAKAEASLAELEILHRDLLGKLADGPSISEAEKNYQNDRRRIEDRLEHEIERLRSAGRTD